MPSKSEIPCGFSTGIHQGGCANHAETVFLTSQTPCNDKWNFPLFDDDLVESAIQTVLF